MMHNTRMTIRGLGNASDQLDDLGVRAIRRHRAETRTLRRDAIILTLAFVGALTVAHKAERVWTGWNAERVEAGQ